MKLPAASVAVLGLLVLGTACAQTDVDETDAEGTAVDQMEGEPTELATTVAPEVPGIVAGGTPVEFIRDGFEGTEGPIPLPDGDLIFTETDASRITRIAVDGEISTYLEDTNGSNALGFDPDGRLISVQTTPGQTRVGVILPSEDAEVFAENFEGRPFGRPNDMIVSSDGDIYFTEPGVGGEGDADPAIYNIPAGGDLRVAYHADDIGFPNGITLSPDERVLYVNDAQGPFLVAFDVQPDGTLINRRDFAAYEEVPPAENGTVSSRADGLAVDTEGRIYSAVPPGVQIFSPEGEHLGTIPVPVRVQNLAFAGPDKQTLYLVGSGSAYKVQMLAEGFGGRPK